MLSDEFTSTENEDENNTLLAVVSVDRVFPECTKLAMLTSLFLLDFENKLNTVVSPINLKAMHHYNFKIA